MYSPTVIHWASKGVKAVGGSWLGRRYRGSGAIFVMHSVVDDARDYLFDPQYTDKRLLKRMLTYYTSNDIDIVSLDQSVDRLKSGNKKPFVCFTFDDGYRDNLDVVSPIFQEFNKPFTTYVTTCFLNRTMDIWWLGLIEILKSSDEILIEFNKRSLHLSLKNVDLKVKNYRLLMQAIASGAVEKESLEPLIRKLNVNLVDILDKLAIDERGLRSLSAMPHVEIGAHTENHPHLRSLTDEQARSEILTNKHSLESLIQTEVRHFAYPYGRSASCGAREFKIAKELGFQTATTTRFGCVFPEHISHLTALPRLRVFSECNSLDVIECARSGTLVALSRGFGNPVVTA